MELPLPLESLSFTLGSFTASRAQVRHLGISLSKAIRVEGARSSRVAYPDTVGLGGTD